MRPPFSLVLLCLSVSPSLGRTTCTVEDLSGTPLNVRTAPYGTIVGALSNGTKVLTLDESRIDARGNAWTHIVPIGPGKEGWVVRRSLECAN